MTLADTLALVDERDVRFLDGRTWRTPLTDRAPERMGTARLIRRHYRGLYHGEGVCGFKYYCARGWLPVTGLQLREGRRWKTWMVDDPVHWDGMREAVERLPNGHILVAGLGLGLMLHHMAAMPRFTRIVVVERSRDVVDLIEPGLPDDARVEIVVDDFYRYIQLGHPRPDGVLWDLAIGKPHETLRDFLVGPALVNAAYGPVPTVCFGRRRVLLRRQEETPNR